MVNIRSRGWAGLALLVLSGTLVVAAESAPRPHVVLIVADDMGFADPGFNGGREIQTPHLDRLCASGVNLTSHYVLPVCSPTRAALLTGRYPMRHGLQVGVVRPWATYGLPLEERTLADALRAAGYDTAIVGKWHLGQIEPAYLPTRRGFVHQYGHYNGAIDYFTHVRDDGFDWHRDDRVCREEGYSTTLLGDEAVRLIRQRDRQRPLFLYVPFNAVHTPLQAPAEAIAPYQQLPEPRRTYAAMLTVMDDAIGRIIQALVDERMREQTLVIFTSDNGGFNPGKVTDNGPLRAGKGTLYEGGVRVAALASWPSQLAPGAVVNEPLHAVDWYPTLLKLAGATREQPLPLDGRDCWDVVRGTARSPHEFILLNTTPQAGALRAGDLKLIINGSQGAGQDVENAAPADAPAADAPAADAADGPTTKKRKKAATAKKKQAAEDRGSVELFDLAADLGEQVNLAAARPDDVARLRAIYDRLAAEAVPPKSRAKAAGFKSPAVWGEFAPAAR